MVGWLAELYYCSYLCNLIECFGTFNTKTFDKVAYMWKEMGLVESILITDDVDL